MHPIIAEWIEYVESYEIEYDEDAVDIAWAAFFAKRDKTHVDAVQTDD